MILRYCASAKFDFLLRTAPPSLIADGALAHDDLIADCLTSILDVNYPALFDEGHSPSAFAQASLPVCQGGLGLGSAQVTSEPAYLAGWVDFLRFTHSHPSFLPALTPYLTSDALLECPLADIRALSDTWDSLCRRLTRVDPQSGDQVPGLYELQGALGPHVKCVADLATAHAAPQKRLNTLCMRALERGWRAKASVENCVRLTECGGREANWVARCPTRPEYCMQNRLWRVAILARLALPLPHLRKQQHGCACHDRHDRRVSSSPRRKRRRRPPPVDSFGEHD